MTGSYKYKSLPNTLYWNSNIHCKPLILIHNKKSNATHIYLLLKQAGKQKHIKSKRTEKTGGKKKHNSYCEKKKVEICFRFFFISFLVIQKCLYLRICTWKEGRRIKWKKLSGSWDMVFGYLGWKLWCFFFELEIQAVTLSKSMHHLLGILNTHP